MHITGIETASVNLHQRKSLKTLKIMPQKVPKEAEAKRDDVINKPEKL